MPYKTIIWNENIGRIDVSGKKVHQRSFIFDFDLIAQEPEPKEIVFQHHSGKYLHEWRMDWERFGNTAMVDNMVIADKKDFEYRKIKLIQPKEEGDVTSETESA